MHHTEEKVSIVPSHTTELVHTTTHTTELVHTTTHTTELVHTTTHTTELVITTTTDNDDHHWIKDNCHHIKICNHTNP